MHLIQCDRCLKQFEGSESKPSLEVQSVTLTRHVITNRCNIVPGGGETVETDKDLCNKCYEDVYNEFTKIIPK